MRQSSQCPPSLEDRLRARRAELEQAALARITAIPGSGYDQDPGYRAGMRVALTTALDYGLAAVTASDREPGTVPTQLLDQARLAARNGVELEAVLRRYVVGHSLLIDGLLDEAAAAEVGPAELKPILSGVVARYDRVIAAVGKEYRRALENEAEPQSSEQRRYGLLRDLLGGERLNVAELSYQFDGHHLALVASGEGAAAVLAPLGEQLDRRLLLAEPDERSAWAWLGGERPFETRDIEFLSAVEWPEQVSLGCGQFGRGLFGWRVSHRQAAAALAIAERRPEGFVHYPDVAVLTSAFHDDLLRISLEELYISPLAGERDQGAVAKDTLRAYFAAGGNVSSAAAALGVHRRTVASRLAGIEERLGRPLDSVRVEIETVLRLDQVEAFSP